MFRANNVNKEQLLDWERWPGCGYIGREPFNFETALRDSVQTDPKTSDWGGVFISH